MIDKYYSTIQLVLCIVTTSLIFYFTIPYVLSKPEAYIRTDRISRMAEEAIRTKPEPSPIKLAGPGAPQYVSAPPVVKIEKSWYDHIATVAHTLEVFSPLSSIAVSIYLWARKRKEESDDKS